jgi:hypothetical protein
MSAPGGGPMTAARWRRCPGTICGGAAALLVFELGLRPFYGETYTQRITTVRQYEEGITTAHYVRDDPEAYSWRVTGNAPIEGAPEVLIVGDSYIFARQAGRRDRCYSI